MMRLALSLATVSLLALAACNAPKPEEAPIVETPAADAPVADAPVADTPMAGPPAADPMTPADGEAPAPADPMAPPADATGPAKPPA
jgi:hypothetical protein